MVASQSWCSIVTPIAPCSWCAMVVTGPTARPTATLATVTAYSALSAVESVVGSGGDRQCCCGAGTLDLTGHRGQRVLHRLERAQRLAELLPLAGVRDGEFGGRVQHADDLHAARPGAATDELVADGQVYRSEPIGGQIEDERSAGFTGQIVAESAHVGVVGDRDVKRVGGARGEHNGG